MNKTEQDQLKKEAATKAAKMVEPNSVLGVGTGSTVAFGSKGVEIFETKKKRLGSKESNSCFSSSKTPFPTGI